MSERTLRQIFGDFKRSKEALAVQIQLLREQLYLCPITKTKLVINQNCHLSHIISVKQLTKLREINPTLAISLVTDKRNLFLEEGLSNRRRSSKPCMELIEDLLEKIDFTQEELEVLNLK